MPFFQVNVGEVRGLVEFFRIVGERRSLPFSSSRWPCAVAREDGAEEPAVAVEIGELRVFQFAR